MYCGNEATERKRIRKLRVKNALIVESGFVYN